ncbi:glycosyltransferase family 1 protein [Xanthocytophaga agilis]|uniref:Glycosyltransferase family 1 protein n=1 Tax=Xanthocytophaga agilis TaxID=3048010 RepID=A0AAE3UJM5_9BACT|nr:glycosyltransferase family 1 protein [Xanthocytophaga agilis]MDJ1506147.1 glycosyltransferase family 1 protein [Xanthocytophaga agilis]
MKTVSKDQSNLLASTVVQITDPLQGTTSIQGNIGNMSDTQLTEDAIDTPAEISVQNLICFSHLRWDFVFQRPQHLMTRAARQWRVFFVEEPVFSDTQEIVSFNERNENNLWVITPQFPATLSHTEARQEQENILKTLIEKYRIEDYVAWYYTPMALAFGQNLTPKVTIYDCMDELSAFKGAPPELLEWEQQLLQKADIVYTGGLSLYEAKRDRHPFVRAFPSSIDKDHFAKAHRAVEPADQATIEAPKFGFYGVIDERFDIDLLRDLAERRPDWHFIIIGPVVKIDPATLPQNPNIHYLGMKSYEQLPAYLAGWDVALLLFARNESTRFISPTKTPEYLAAHRPVVSTPITDVIRPYGEVGLVHIAESAEEFEQAIEKALNEAGNTQWQQRVDEFLANNSWDYTWQQMQQLITKLAETKTRHMA